MTAEYHFILIKKILKTPIQYEKTKQEVCNIQRGSEDIKFEQKRAVAQMIKLPSWVKSQLVYSELGGTVDKKASHRPGI